VPAVTTGIAQPDNGALTEAALLEITCKSALELEVATFAKCANAAADGYTEGAYDAWLDAYHSCASEVDAFMTPLKVAGGECALPFKTAPPAEDLAKMRRAEAAAKKRAEETAAKTLAERDAARKQNTHQQTQLLAAEKKRAADASSWKQAAEALAAKNTEEIAGMKTAQKKALGKMQAAEEDRT